MRHRLSGGGWFWCEHVNDRRTDKNNQPARPSVFLPSFLWIKDRLEWFGDIITGKWRFLVYLLVDQHSLLSISFILFHSHLLLHFPSSLWLFMASMSMDVALWTFFSGAQLTGPALSPTPEDEEVALPWGLILTSYQSWWRYCPRLDNECNTKCPNGWNSWRAKHYHHMLQATNYIGQQNDRNRSKARVNAGVAFHC